MKRVTLKPEGCVIDTRVGNGEVFWKVFVNRSILALNKKEICNEG